jgi:polyisoprenoid-binding protein YceI
MKTNYLKQLLVLAFVFLAKNVMLSQVVGDFTVSKPENGSFTYHWTDPVLQTVNIDSVRKQKEKSENHLKGLNLLDD